MPDDQPQKIAWATPDEAPALAKDGTKRGLHRRGKKNRATLLLEEMQRVVEEKYQLKGFDPVVMLAVIGMEAMYPVPQTGSDGEMLYDADGNPLYTPADRTLAMNAFSKAAPYVRSTLKSIEIAEKDDDNPQDANVSSAKERLARMAGALSGAIIEIGQEDSEEDEEDDDT